MIGPAEDVVPQGFLLEESCMTREEQKKEKLKKEQEFIESIKGKALNQQEKSKFRETTVWKDFRNPFKGEVDPITLRKLPKRFALHQRRKSQICRNGLRPGITDEDKRKSICLSSRPFGRRNKSKSS